jgi:hypothetical protein
MKKHNRDAYQFADDYVVEDGDPPVRVPAMICDSAGHCPGYWVKPLTNKQVAERLAAYDAKRKSRDQDDPGEDDPDEIESLEATGDRLMDIRRPSIEARDAYVASLSSAWRNATPQRLMPGKQTDAVAEPVHSSPSERDPDAVQLKRDQAWQEYAASLATPGKPYPRRTLWAPRLRLSASA